MSKDFTEVAFHPAQFKKELDQFHALLSSKTILSERELQALFKASPHLTAYIGTTFGNIGVAKLVAYEFQILGDYAADIAFGNPEKQFCFVELEDGNPGSVLQKVGKKSTKEWARSFEHGFSQIVDWFCHLHASPWLRNTGTRTERIGSSATRRGLLSTWSFASWTGWTACSPD